MFSLDAKVRGCVVLESFYHRTSCVFFLFYCFWIPSVSWRSHPVTAITPHTSHVQSDTNVVMPSRSSRTPNYLWHVQTTVRAMDLGQSFPVSFLIVDLYLEMWVWYCTIASRSSSRPRSPKAKQCNVLHFRFVVIFGRNTYVSCISILQHFGLVFRATVSNFWHCTSRMYHRRMRPAM